MRKRLFFLRNLKRRQSICLSFFLVVCLCNFFSAEAIAQVALKVRGENYGILPLEKGQQPFFNRTNMSFGDIPNEYVGWKFVKINANSTYLPGLLPVLEVEAEEDGYVIAMVENKEKPDVCKQWAEKNGWELLPGSSLSYGGGPMQTLFFYRKPIQANTWTKIEQPATFSGAIIIASTLKEAVDEARVQSVPVRITAMGWMETSRFMNGTTAFANRAYVFENVPKELAGLTFTRYNGGGAPKLRVIAEEAGDLYIAVITTETDYKPEEEGWTLVEGLNFRYTDGDKTAFNVYKRTVAKEETLSIQTTSWQGVLLFSEDIEYTNFQSITSPPGTVIYNSKAVTKKFVGSPSITILPDGTYLASHDIFGGLISYTYIYRSVDKGKTWEKISEINPLTWGKLFTRGQDLYMIGIAPRCTMGYGNIVILQSTDKGHTWTTPKDGQSGLLRQGYYHTAPTPVVFHKGRVWKGMENQGDAYWGWGPFAAFMLSAKEDADFLKVENWTFSNELQYVAGAVPANTWLEGNAVIAKDGSMKDILRLDYNKDDKAGVISISDDGKKATFNAQTDISNVPGACKKFTIRYDSLTNRYWTLSNYVFDAYRGHALGVGGVRNAIVLSYSEDLVDWTIKDTLLFVAEPVKYGFQYLDWLFDGDDIIAVSRTAWDDETGQADNQHNANFLTFHRFHNFRYERAVLEQDIAVSRWSKNAKSAFALTFDDGFKAHYQHAFPVLQKYNLQGTFFVNSGNLVKRGETQKERYGFWEDFKEMSEAGHEIASHSLSHQNLTSVDYDVLENELKKDKENIETFIGKPCLTHAYPYCLHNETVDQMAAPLFIAARQCGSVFNSIPTEEQKWFSVNSELLTWTYPRSLQNEKQSFEVLKGNINKLNGNFGVVCIHETLPFDLLNTSSTYEIATTEWLEDVCKELSDQQEAGKVWVTTLANIARYTKERENLRISKQEFSKDSIQYDFSTWLDSSIYNVPLTVECAFPEDWNQARVLIKDGEKVISDQILFSTDGKITLDIIPDRESLTLVNATGVDIVTQKIRSEIQVYPNPVKEVLYMQNLQDEIYCEVFDFQGRLILSKSVQSASGMARMNVGNLSAGIYLVRFLSLDHVPLYSFNMVKQ